MLTACNLELNLSTFFFSLELENRLLAYVPLSPPYIPDVMRCNSTPVSHLWSLQWKGLHCCFLLLGFILGGSCLLFSFPAHLPCVYCHVIKAQEGAVWSRYLTRVQHDQLAPGGTASERACFWRIRGSLGWWILSTPWIMKGAQDAFHAPVWCLDYVERLRKWGIWFCVIHIQQE